MLILSTQLFFLSHTKCKKTMKKEKGIFCRIFPFFGRKNLSNFEKEKKIIFFWLHFHWDYFRGKGD